MPFFQTGLLGVRVINQTETDAVNPCMLQSILSLNGCNWSDRYIQRWSYPLQVEVAQHGVGYSFVQGILAAHLHSAIYSYS